MVESDREGFVTFYAANYKSVVAQIFILTRSRTAAEDAAQEAFAKAWSRWRRVDELEQPLAWVRRVAMNRAISAWRQKVRHEPSQKPGVDGADQTEAALVERMDLLGALEALPVHQRRAIILHFVAGLTSEEIATEMSVRPATVRSWIARGRASLQMQLRPLPSQTLREADGGNHVVSPGGVCDERA